MTVVQYYAFGLFVSLSDCVSFSLFMCGMFWKRSTWILWSFSETWPAGSYCFSEVINFWAPPGNPNFLITFQPAAKFLLHHHHHLEMLPQILS